jgi:hypothetical protein
MPSQIDPTVPVTGNPTTASVRSNFQVAHDEITALQAATNQAPYMPLAGGRFTGTVWLAGDPTDAMMPATKGYVDAGGSGGGGGIPEAPADGVTYGRRNGGWMGVLPLAGGTMTGALTLAGAPVGNLDAVTKAYADAIKAAALPDAPTDGGYYARRNAAWAAVMSIAGGVLTGSLGINVAIPAAPAPNVPTLFASPATVDELDLNAYQSSAGAWTYRATGTAGRIRLDPTTGVLTLAAAPQGNAGAVVTFGTAVRIDAVGSLMLGATVIPTDTIRAVLAAPQLTMANGGVFSTNLYANSGGWRYLAAGYGQYQYLDANGVWTLALFATAAANAATGAVASLLTFSQAGLLSVGAINASSGRIVSQLAGNASVTAYNTTVGSATGFWTPAAGQLGLGSLNATGVPATMWANLTATVAWFCSLTDFALFTGSGNRYHQYAGNGYYWMWTSSTGDLTWVVANTSLWVMRTSDKLTYNNLAAVGGVGAYVNLSDERTKQDIAPLTYGLPEVLRLKPRSFRRIGDADAPVEIGFIAQEVQPVIPEVVTIGGFGLAEDEGGIDAANPSLALAETSIIAVLVNAIKTLDVRLTAIEGGA